MARTAPPTVASATLKQCDRIVHHCFSECVDIDTYHLRVLAPTQLSPSREGLGLRSLFHHSSVAYIALFCNSDCDDVHLKAAIDLYNLFMLPSDQV